MTAQRYVVVGYDGSTDAQSAVAWAAKTAAALGAHLRVVHAVGLLEHAGMTGHAQVDGETRRSRSRPTPGSVRARWSGTSSTATRARPCSAWPSRRRWRRCSWSAPEGRVATPARSWAARASNSPSTPGSR